MSIEEVGNLTIAQYRLLRDKSEQILEFMHGGVEDDAGSRKSDTHYGDPFKGKSNKERAIREARKQGFI